MLQVVAGRRAAASLAALALAYLPAAATAQTAEPTPADPGPSPFADCDERGGVDCLAEVDQPLDPSAPLEEWPDLGVPWPDLEEDQGTPIAEAPQVVADPAGATTYDYRITGLDGEDPETIAILAQFRQLSTLQQYEGEPANAAQVDRRARADADLLAELLRAHGYYAGEVTTIVEASAAGAYLVTLDAEPGPLYRFAAIDLTLCLQRPGASIVLAAERLADIAALAPHDRPPRAGRKLHEGGQFRVLYVYSEIENRGVERRKSS